MPFNGSARSSARRNTKGRSPPSLREKVARELERLRQERAARTIQVSKPYLPHVPSPKQSLFLGLTCEEALFGGAAGGGKSDALLMSALQYVDVPGYSAIIFRRTKTDLNLPDSILARAHTWWAGTAAKWDPDLYGYRFPTRPGQPDATIAFAFLQHEQDKFRYKSAAFQFCAFDELTAFTQTQYTYLFSRLRRLKGSTVPIRMRGATNPGDVGHEWVKRRFIEHGKEVSPDLLVSPPSAEVAAVAQELGRSPEGAYFVRSLGRDNPGLDFDQYRLQLARLDPISRRQLEEGDWDAVGGGEFFKPGWFRFLDSAPAGTRWVRYWDLAATEPHEGNPDPDWTAGVLVGIHRDKDSGARIIIKDCVHMRGTPGDVQRAIKTAATLDGRAVPVWIEEEPGSAGKNNTAAYRQLLMGWPVYGHRKTGPKETFWRPLSAQAEAGNVYLIEGPWNESFVSELCALPHGKKDQADAASGGFDRLIEPSGLDKLRMMTHGL
jgi:predicted phage terminase large subunit-like protein